VMRASHHQRTKVPLVPEAVERAQLVPRYTRKEPIDDMTSRSRSNTSSWEIRYHSLTLMFVCLVMVNFVVSGKAHS
jgi:hypothetical protein